MAEKRTLFYKLTGWTTVVVVTEAEMAQELGITVADLHHACEKHGLSYHAHPLATGGEYLFLPELLKENKEKWECIQAGGHAWEFDRYYDARRQLAVWKCPNCPAKKYD